MWVGQTGQLLCTQGEKTSIYKLPERSAFPKTDLKFDLEGNLYISTRKQVYRLPSAQLESPQKARFELIYRFHEVGVFGSTNMLVDRSGLLWIGTNGHGLKKYNPGNPRFHLFLSGKSPRRILPDPQGRVWA